MKKLLRTLNFKFAKLKSRSRTQVPSIISLGTKIKGDILAADVIQIDGKLEGNVTCQELIVGVQGQVVGEIKAKNLSIYGVLQGKIEAENMFVAATAKVIGNVQHRSLAIEPGAYIEGNCQHFPKTEIAAGKGVVTPISAAGGYK